MKPRIQATLAALLLAALAAGCWREPSHDNPGDFCVLPGGDFAYGHDYGPWKQVAWSRLDAEEALCERTCESCGWVERKWTR